MSILPVLFKILERVVYKPLLSHLENNGLLSDVVRKEVDNGNILAMLFLSIYQKHLTLLVTRVFLTSCRLMELMDYLFSRTQTVQYNSKVCQIEICRMSFPYFLGNILGPLLFTIYFTVQEQLEDFLLRRIRPLIDN